MDKLLHDIMRQADAVIITAGAGMGVDSGLPDFRGKEGLWKNIPRHYTAPPSAISIRAGGLDGIKTLIGDY